MSGKTLSHWVLTRVWCEAHPGQTAAVVTPEGVFRITFTRQDTPPPPAFFNRADFFEWSQP